MQKPKNYDETQVNNSDYTPVAVGGHMAIIKRVEEVTSKNGKDMLKIAIDFDKADSQPDYFMNAFKNDERPDKKWPFQGTLYILTEDENGNTTRNLKGFITSVENSNNAQCVWGDGFAKWFTGKKVGVIYGRVEEEYNGECKMRVRFRWFCEYANAKNAKVPNDKFLAIGAKKTVAPSDDFVSIPSGVEEEEIPF